MLHISPVMPQQLRKKPGAAPGSILVIPVERLLLMVKKSWISYQGITQIHTLSVVQGAGAGGRGGAWVDGTRPQSF